MSTWILLERTAQLLPQLYQLLGAPSLTMLFDSTELAPYADQSPILVPDDGASLLLNAIRKAPEEWPGLIISSEQPNEILLAHLRHILLVRFGENRRGVLRYTSPLTASYFFPACQDDQLGLWLGPISALEWYGGTWAERAMNQKGWRRLENPDALTEALTCEPTLSADQQQALYQQRQDQFLYNWWRKQGDVAYSRADAWLQEARQCGLINSDSFEQFLTLRRTFPQPELPAFMAGDDEARLAQLQTHLQPTRPEQES